MISAGGFEDEPESAAYQGLVVDEQDADVRHPAPSSGSRARTAKPAGLRADLEVSTDHRHPLPHPDDAVTGVRRPRPAWPAAGAIVDDRQSQVGVAEAHLDPGRAVAGVAQGVGQRFLDDTKCRHVDALGQWPGPAFHDEFDRQPGLAGTRQQGVQPGQAGLRFARVRTGVVGAQHTEQAAQFGQGLAADLLDRGELGPQSIGVGSTANRAAPALTTMTVTSWVTMSCNSRAMRCRSAAAAAATLRSRSASSRRARACSSAR